MNLNEGSNRLEYEGPDKLLDSVSDYVDEHKLLDTVARLDSSQADSFGDESSLEGYGFLLKERLRNDRDIDPLLNSLVEMVGYENLSEEQLNELKQYLLGLSDNSSQLLKMSVLFCSVEDDADYTMEDLSLDDQVALRDILAEVLRNDK